MIEIVIPYWFNAYSLGVAMIFSLVGFIISLVLGKLDLATGCIIILFLLDFFALGLSSAYMTTPITGMALFEDKTKCVNHEVDGFYKCIYPTVNPYEKQPMHPLYWIVNIVENMYRVATDMISVRKEYL